MSHMHAPYAYGTIMRTIRVWLYHMRIRVWYVPYAYGINTRMVQNINIHKYESKVSETAEIP